MVWKTTKKLEIYNQEELKQIANISEKVSKERLLKIIYTLSELESDMKWSSQKSVLFEVAMIKLCQPVLEGETSTAANSQGLEDLNNRITQLEKKIAQGNFGNAQITKSTNETVETKEKSGAKAKSSAVKVEKVDLKSLNISQLEFWPKIINQLKEDRKMLLATNLLNTVATLLNDMTVGIVFQNGLTPFVKSLMERPENMQELTRVISIECGKEMRIKLLDNQDAILKQKAKEQENPINDLDIPINVIDE